MVDLCKLEIRSGREINNFRAPTRGKICRCWCLAATTPLRRAHPTTNYGPLSSLIYLLKFDHIQTKGAPHPLNTPQKETFCVNATFLKLNNTEFYSTRTVLQVNSICSTSCLDTVKIFLLNIKTNIIIIYTIFKKMQLIFFSMVKRVQQKVNSVKKKKF